MVKYYREVFIIHNKHRLSIDFQLGFGGAGTPSKTIGVIVKQKPGDDTPNLFDFTSKKTKTTVKFLLVIRTKGLCEKRFVRITVHRCLGIVEGGRANLRLKIKSFVSARHQNLFPRQKYGGGVYSRVVDFAVKVHGVERDLKNAEANAYHRLRHRVR